MWKVGEAVVFIHGHPGYVGPMPLRLGQKVTIAKVSPFPRQCEWHPKTATSVTVREIPTGTFCSHCFRKPINFNIYLFTVVNQKEPARGR